MFLKSSRKAKYEIQTPTMLRKISKKDENLLEKTIEQETNSDEIAEIISKRLLDLIEKKINI